MKFRLALTLLVAVLSCGCTPYWTGAKMQEDIEALEAEQKALNDSLAEREAELTEMIAAARAETTELRKVLKEATALLRRNNADFGVEMEELRQEVEMLRGRVEEMDFRLSRLEQELKLFKEDVDIRFAEGGGIALPQDSTELFKFAASKMQAGETRAARKAWQAFLDRNPKDRRADEALFWIGETFFKEGQFVSAIYEYQKVLESHPKSDRMDDSAFRIGESFVKLGKCNEAKVFFETIVKDYPKSKWKPASSRKLKDIESGKCK